MCGEGCAEFDILEANSEAARVTAHTCDSSTSCDSNGCGTGVESFGRGGGFAVDTTRPFVVEFDFKSSSKSTTTFRQCGAATTIVHDDASCGSGYMEAMAATRDDMAIAISSWGDDESGMAWLDGAVCGANDVCNRGAWRISSFALQDSGGDGGDDDVGCGGDDDRGGHSNDDDDDAIGFGWGFPWGIPWYIWVSIAASLILCIICCMFNALLEGVCSCVCWLLEKVLGCIRYVLCCEFYPRSRSENYAQQPDSMQRRRKKPQHRSTRGRTSDLKEPLI